MRRVADLLLAGQRDGMVHAQLVRAALTAGVARPAHLSWLEQAEARGVRDRTLSKDLAQALGR